MATPLLMAPNDNHQTTKTRLPTNQPHPTRHAPGRRKVKVCDSSKKKVPQRGMGVEKLEKLWRMTEIKNANQHLNVDPSVLGSSPVAVLPKLSGFMAPVVAQMGYARYDHGRMLVPDLDQGGTHGIGKNVSGKSREHLSLTANAPKCLYENCTCHKGVEIVAVHRRGSDRYGGGSMLMEYEFFPHRRTQSSSSSSSFSGPAASSSSVTGFHDFNQIDLSLKLSY